MSGSLRVQWTVTPKNAPQPQIACNRCGCRRPFRSSGKFRVNAQGKSLDAWLIYRCTSCQSTWNRPVLERQNVREVDPALLQALQSNSRTLATTLAFDMAWLQRHTQAVQECIDADVRKEIISGAVGPWLAVEIVMNVPFHISSRTDRLLAKELGLSRAQIQRLERNGCLRVTQPEGFTIRRPTKHQMRICIDMQGISGRFDLGMAATSIPEHEASEAS